MRRASAVCAGLLAGALCGPLVACKQPERKPIAGLLAAGAPLYLKTADGKRPIAVGSQLMPTDEIVASGPAVLEFYRGGIRFFEEGDALEVGDAREATINGGNVRLVVLRNGTLEERPPAQRIIAARYRSISFTPESSSTELKNADYMRAFFTPNGIANLQGGPAGEGPRKKLPPPPHRRQVPHVRAGELGEGGPRIVIEDEFVVAESDDLTTAVLIEGPIYELGRTTRLLMPEGAEATLTTADGRQLELEGPMDLVLR